MIPPKLPPRPQLVHLRIEPLQRLGQVLEEPRFASPYASTLQRSSIESLIWPLLDGGFIPCSGWVPGQNPR